MLYLKFADNDNEYDITTVFKIDLEDNGFEVGAYNNPK
jgi:hypothetical protein